MIIKEIRYDCWERCKSDFLKDLNLESSDSYKGCNLIFRGQPNSHFELTSTFDRTFPSIVGKEKNRISTELLDLFVEECDYNFPDIINWSRDEQIAFARHHGLPTRLLDWSNSIYVAIFFAFAYCHDENCQDVAIYALDKTSELISDETGLKILKPHSKANYRQKAQQGLYTLLNTYHNSIDEYVREYQRNLPSNYNPMLYKILLPQYEKNKILIDLNFMNINYSILFGDAEGCASNALMKYYIKSR